MSGSECPGLIVNICRSGPGLGGIDASQADYFQATKGGRTWRLSHHCPGNRTVCRRCTTWRFWPLICRIVTGVPAMILADAVIGQMKEALEPHPYVKPDDLGPKDWALIGDGKAGEQKIVKSLYLGDGELEAHNNRLHAKYAVMQEKETRYEGIGLDDAELLVTAYGSTARIAKTAVRLAR